MSSIPIYRSVPFWLGLGAAVIGTTVVSWLTYRYFSRTITRKLLSDPNAKYTVELIDKKELCPNVKRLRFELPPNSYLGLSPGQHIYLSALINDQMVVRTYSPVSSDKDLGFMDIIVKVYFKDTHPFYPSGGKMSQYLNELEIGDTVDIRGPAGRMIYHGDGKFVIRQDKQKHKMSASRVINATHINMIAGGSGITPMLQILHSLFSPDKNNEIQPTSSSNIENNKLIHCSLIYANQSESDIICRNELDELFSIYPNYFHLHYTLSSPPNQWSGGVGRVDVEMFRTHLFPPSSSTISLMCGPAGMINSTTVPALEELGYEPSLCYVY